MDLLPLLSDFLHEMNLSQCVPRRPRMEYVPTHYFQVFCSIYLLLAQVVYREGPTLTGFRQRHGNDVSINDLSGASQINLMSECLDEDLGSPVESDDGMSDISSNSERQQYIDMHVSNSEDNHSLEEGGEAYDIVMQDNDTDEGCYDLGGGDGSSGCETGDSEGDSTPTSSHGATSRKGLLSSLVRHSDYLLNI